MASLRKEILLDAPAERVWDAIRDFGAVHERVAPGFVIDCTVEGDTRVVTFANGSTAREALVDLDDSARRFVYAIRNDRISHYNAALQVFAEDGGRTRLVWTVDLLPHDLKDYIAHQMDNALRAIESTFLRSP
jgi:carbon monoxide dehydrogenase subunit G